MHINKFYSESKSNLRQASSRLFLFLNSACLLWQLAAWLFWRTGTQTFFFYFEHFFPRGSKRSIVVSVLSRGGKKTQTHFHSWPACRYQLDGRFRTSREVTRDLDHHAKLDGQTRSEPCARCRGTIATDEVAQKSKQNQLSWESDYLFWSLSFLFGTE